MADTGHNLSDVLGLLLAWGATRVAQVAPTERRTYGVHRSTIFAALLSALLLLIAVGAIALEAVRRPQEPEPIPVVSLAIVLIILIRTWGLLRHSVNLALDAALPGIGSREAEGYCSVFPRSLRCTMCTSWATSTTEVVLTAHLVKSDPPGDDELIARVPEDLRACFEIRHRTVQWERSPHTFPCGDPCQAAPTVQREDAQGCGPMASHRGPVASYPHEGSTAAV